MAIYRKGADTAALAVSAGRFADYSREIDAIRDQVDIAVRSAEQSWAGRDLGRFVDAWSGQQGQMTSMSMRIREMAEILRRNAEAQDRASAADGTASGFSRTPPMAGGGGSSGTRNRPVNPDPKGGMGPYKPVGKVPMNDSDMELRDVKQGQLGDCWLVSTLAVVAHNDPDFVRNHISYNERMGTYTVKLYDKSGNPVYVTVDATAPENGLKNPDGSYNWASVYEKAFASYRGSYDELDGGWPKDAMQTMTGQKTESVNNQSIEDIRRGLNEGRVYVANSENKHTWLPFDEEIDDTKVVGNHSYMVDKVEMRDGEMKIHLINPWAQEGKAEGDPNLKSADLWLTQKEYNENFAKTDSMQGKKP